MIHSLKHFVHAKIAVKVGRKFLFYVHDAPLLSILHKTKQTGGDDSKLPKKKKEKYEDVNRDGDGYECIHRSTGNLGIGPKVAVAYEEVDIICNSPSTIHKIHYIIKRYG